MKCRIKQFNGWKIDFYPEEGKIMIVLLFNCIKCQTKGKLLSWETKIPNVTQVLDKRYNLRVVKNFQR